VSLPHRNKGTELVLVRNNNAGTSLSMLYGKAPQTAIRIPLWYYLRGGMSGRTLQTTRNLLRKQKTCSEDGQVASSWESGNEPSGSIKYGKFLD
jgi:hypothetical protein